MNYNNENRWSNNRSEAGRDGKSNYNRDTRGNSENRERRSPRREFGNRDNRDSRGGYGNRDSRDSRSSRDNSYRTRDSRNSGNNSYGNRNSRDAKGGSYGNRDARNSSRPNRYTSDNERGFNNSRRSFPSDRTSNREYNERRFNSEERSEKLKFRSRAEVNESLNAADSEGKRKRKRITVTTNSYDPNAKYSKKKQFAHKQNFVDPNKPIRLNKYLANAGVCSRREADDFIKAGVISVNGEIVTELGTKVLISDKVMFHEQPVSIERKVYILLNKPKDCVTTTDDPQDRHTVMDIVKNACSERIYPVGRLDRNTTGVLLLTNDGELASKLTHPKFEKRKIYEVGLDKELTTEDFNTILNEGVDLGDFTIKADDLSFIKDQNRKNVGIEIHSGQNRVIRRIFESLGYKVIRLDRVYYAGLTKKNVPRGKYRFLNEKEVIFLKMNSGG